LSTDLFKAVNSQSHCSYFVFRLHDRCPALCGPAKQWIQHRDAHHALKMATAQRMAISIADVSS
jgi:hypothetical protein